LWKRIEQLRALGVDVEATAGKGYRLAQPLDLLDAGHICAQVEHDAPGLLRSLAVEWSIESTNAAVAQFGHDLHGRVVLAEHQTGGRGRRGRTWQSPLAANLYLSVGWRFACGAAGLAGLSVAVGIAAVESLRQLGFDDVALKWPNDLVAHGKKLGGLLIEVGGEIGGPSHVVIGIGVNARMPKTAAEAIDQPWIDLDTLSDEIAEALQSSETDRSLDLSADASRSVRRQTGRTIGRSPSKPHAGNVDWTRTSVAATLTAAILNAARQFDEAGFATFRAKYEQFDALKDTPITIHLGDKTIEAIAQGIDDNGLLVARIDGETRRFASGEITVRRRA
jgi:BirA family biotin operon repressor/biotin-[acetyl-CoA-carboxylase] ligase